MTGLAGTPAAQASLLLNAEAVLTALIARFMFKENFDRRTAIGLEHSHPHEHDEHHRHLYGGGVSAAASLPTGTGMSPWSTRIRTIRT